MILQEIKWNGDLNIMDSTVNDYIFEGWKQ